MHFINGFLIGYFWRYIIAIALIFGAMGGISYLTNGKPLIYTVTVSSAAMFIILPVIACLCHKYTMWRAGRPSALYSVLRALYGFYLIATIGLVGLSFFMKDKIDTGPLPLEEAEAIRALIKNETIAETFINLPTYGMLIVGVIPFVIVFIIMSAYGRKIMRKHAQFLFDRDANIVAEGVKRALSDV